MQKLDIFALLLAFCVEILRAKHEIIRHRKRLLEQLRLNPKPPLRNKSQVWIKFGVATMASIATSLFLFTHYVLPYAEPLLT